MFFKKNKPIIEKEFSKVELMLGIEDGDTFSIRGDSKNYIYDKKSNTIKSLGDNLPITSENLLKILDNQENIIREHERLDFYDFLEKTTINFINKILIFFLLMMICFKFSINAQGFVFCVWQILYTICAVGMGVCGGVLVTKLLSEFN